MAAVSQTAFNRFYFTFIDHITMYIGYTGNAGENTGAICVAQAALDTILGEHLRLNQVIFLEIIA